MQLAKDMGMKVEQRRVPVEELATFEEAGACGTAAVISPISRIDDLAEKKTYVFCEDDKPGPVCEKLYHKLRAIQYGDDPDPYGWITVLIKNKSNPGFYIDFRGFIFSIYNKDI